jgi:hypothetical protein
MEKSRIDYLKAIFDHLDVYYDDEFRYTKKMQSRRDKINKIKSNL